MVVYSDQFFEERAREIHVAEHILRIVVPLVRPRSLVDLGTAVGTWPSAAKNLGIDDVFGLDGPWVPTKQLLIEPNEFRPVDFEKSLPDLGRRFDLAVCTEVLEHISRPASERAVEWLCRHAPVILFSAAIPLQGGTNHINEAWQSHWAERFARFGFRTYDVVRPQIWAEANIPIWYRQNILLMADEAHGSDLGLVPASSQFLDFVHPEAYEHKLARLRRLDARSIAGRYNAVRRFCKSRIWRRLQNIRPTRSRR